MVAHKDLTGLNLHEPKGIEGAAAAAVYLADGEGSGAWGVLLSPGDSAMFPMASAPVGWTQDATVNDRVLRVVSGEGAGTGGSWTISGVTVDNTTLTTSHLPSHAHGAGSLTAASHNHSYNDSSGGNFKAENGTARNVGNTTDNTGNSGSLNVSGNTGSAGSGSAHGHGLTADGNWRPAYLNIIKADKD